MLRLSIVALIACSAPPRRAIPPASPPVAPTQPAPVAQPTPLPPHKPLDLAERRQAVLALEAACNKDDVNACVEFARELDLGKFIDMDPPRALALREAACKRKHAEGCYELASQIHSDFDRTRADAIPFYLQACELGDVRACVTGAELANRPELARRAEELAHPYCEQGVIDNCRKSDGKDVWQRAIAALEKLCTDVGGSECWDLAAAIDAGKVGLEPDPGRVRDLKLRACYTGDRDACWTLATDASFAPLADKLTHVACDIGHGAACEALAQAAEAANDPAQALAWYRRSCDLAWNSGCYRAADIFAGNTGLPPDPAAENEIWARACSFGINYACFNVAEFARDAGDMKRARQLYARACMLGEIPHGCAGELGLLREMCKTDKAWCADETARIAELPLYKRDLALYMCCQDESKPPTTPTAALVQLAVAVPRDDRKALAALVHPRYGLAVTVGARTAKLTTRTVAAKELEGTTFFDWEQSIRCKPPERDVATCTTDRSDDNTYRVRMVGGRAYIVSIAVKSD